jgi:hypothetical protein
VRPAPARHGCEYVLVTGTHDSTTADVVNTLYHRGGVLRADSWQRLPGSYHAPAARSPRRSPRTSPAAWTSATRSTKRRTTPGRR